MAPSALLHSAGSAPFAMAAPPTHRSQLRLPLLTLLSASTVVHTQFATDPQQIVQRVLQLTAGQTPSPTSQSRFDTNALFAERQLLHPVPDVEAPRRNRLSRSDSLELYRQFLHEADGSKHGPVAADRFSGMSTALLEYELPPQLPAQELPDDATLQEPLLELELELDDDFLPLPPRLPPRELDPNRLYALYDFQGPDPLHCNLKRDEPVELINDDDAYWWLVRRCADDKIGFALADILETPGERLARLNCWKNEEAERGVREGTHLVPQLPVPRLRRRVKTVTFHPDLAPEEVEEVEVLSEAGSVPPLVVGKRAQPTAPPRFGHNDTTTEIIAKAGRPEPAGPAMAPPDPMFRDTASIGTFLPDTTPEGTPVVQLRDRFGPHINVGPENGRVVGDLSVLLEEPLVLPLETRFPRLEPRLLPLPLHLPPQLPLPLIPETPDMAVPVSHAATLPPTPLTPSLRLLPAQVAEKLKQTTPRTPPPASSPRLPGARSDSIAQSMRMLDDLILDAGFEMAPGTVLPVSAPALDEPVLEAGSVPEAESTRDADRPSLAAYDTELDTNVGDSNATLSSQDAPPLHKMFTPLMLQFDDLSQRMRRLEEML